MGVGGSHVAWQQPWLTIIVTGAFCIYLTSATNNTKNGVARDQLELTWIINDSSSSVTAFCGMAQSNSSRVIVVAKDGSGHSRTVQRAVDMVPPGNRQRVKILIRAGVYREKVTVGPNRSFISFIGEGSAETIITWNSRASDKDPNGQVLGTSASASVAIESDYFCATRITFQNTAPPPLPGAAGGQAVALRVSGDKAVFVKCRMVGSQDTLFDHFGRHYFWDCYIEGSIDFVFGDGRSLYQECKLHANAASFGAVAASQRSSPLENSGFSFVHCKLTGSGILYLGRAWGPYATTIYAFCHFDNIINPQGWYDWGDASRRSKVLFGEYKCSGPGANMNGRVPWARRLSFDQVKPYLGRQFIDGDEWLRV